MASSAAANFASDGLDLRTLDRIRQQKNGLDILIDIRSPFPITLSSGLNATAPVNPDCRVGSINFDQGTAVLIAPGGSQARARISDIEKHTSIMVETLAHVWHGVTEPGEQLGWIIKPDFALEEVRVMTSSAVLYDTTYEKGTLVNGVTIKVGKSPMLNDIQLITNDGKQFFPVLPDVLEGISQLKLHDKKPPTDADDDTLDFTASHDTPRTVLIVRQNILGVRQGCRPLVLRKGAKLQLLHQERDSHAGLELAWMETTKRQKFVVTIETALSSMAPINTMRVCLQFAASTKHSCKTGPQEDDGLPCWTAHTHHNDRVTFQQSKPSQASDLWDNPCTEGGLPLPDDGWHPPQQYINDAPSDFGHFAFCSDDDASIAEHHGYLSGNEVVHAVQNGSQDLDNILLRWQPGTVEGSQGSFDSAPAKIHIYMINFRRRHSFGRGPVPASELAVYTGTSEFWIEEPGADGSGLDQFCIAFDYSSKPAQTENQIEQQIVRRQGYGAPTKPGTGKSASTNTTMTAVQRQALRNTILRANSRYASLGFPTTTRHPINPNDPLKLQTAFHSDYFDCGHEEKLPDIIYALKTSPDALFLDCIKKQYPRLNADGETIWVVMKENEGTNPRRRKPKMQLDIPSLPAHLAAGEDAAVFSAYGAAGIDLEQSMALLDDTDLALGHASQISSCRKAASSNYKLPVKHPSQAQQQQNSGRGSIPGLIDPRLPRNQHINYNGQNVVNWVVYPESSKDRLLGARRKAEAERLKKLNQACEDLTRKQIAAGTRVISQAPSDQAQQQDGQSGRVAGKKRKASEIETDQDVKEEISAQASDVTPQQATAVPAAVEQQLVPSIPDLPTTEVALADPFLPVPTLMEDGLQSASVHMSNGDMGTAAEEILKAMEGDRRDA
ncbi:hypothetical protein HII31_03779 [Pseudocercospora fuligena]|uniref:Uncharacterized protein n=1 Tax=Pseudocercospora fuligena TaxID=685502 RepID=A0A8H6RPR9_9PEZI|nr:hypothetical protein HII31_03779 [Pseudocercospora fuligena]